MAIGMHGINRLAGRFATARAFQWRAASTCSLRVRPALTQCHGVIAVLGRRTAAGSALKNSISVSRGVYGRSATKIQENGLGRELARAEAVLKIGEIPTERDLLQALESCERLAKSISSQLDPSSVEEEPLKSPTTSLLNLEHDRFEQNSQESTSDSLRSSWKDSIEGTTYRIMTDPLTFITPQMLRIYIRTLATLGRPQSFPYIFDLFASKPIPIAGSSPLEFRLPEPTSFRVAIPMDIAKLALNSAITTHNLALCINIISTTVGTNAFRRSKALRKVSIPAVFLSLTPWFSYKAAELYVEYSPRLDESQAFGMMFMGSMAFFSMTTITGYVLFTTGAWMERVTWKPGTPLYMRWLKEEERAFLDEIAMKWGFSDHLKHGEEQGEDWANLREWVMEKRMELDRPERMEGME